ncbi:MAG: hypothetical protein V9G24_13620 [Rhodoblastus sp.]
MTSALASSAPPPTTISGFFAPPRILASFSAVSGSTGGRCGCAMIAGATGVRLPQTSMAHSTITGRWRPDSAADKAVAAVGAASCGASMRAANFVMWRARPT